MLNGGGGSILFLPFGGLGDDTPPAFPLLCLHLGKIFVVRVNVGRIHDGLGSVSVQDRCIGDGGCHCLGHGRDEAPEDIRRNGRRRRVFVVVIFLPSFPCCHYLPSLLGLFISWV